MSSKFQQMLYHLFYVLLLLICAGGIEVNPGPRKDNSSYNFSLYHWNLNSIATNNFSKLSLLEAYNMQHRFHMFCLSETFLDSSIPPNNERLYMKGYKLIRPDTPSNSKKGGVGIYYKEFLAVLLVGVKNLNECVEMSIKIKRRYVVSLHKCHHHIIFLKVNTQIEYPPLYERLIWDEKNADIPSI